jgi:hypothetical protein
MSLAERLSVMEEYESLRDPSPAGSGRRKMSFNPLPAKWVPPGVHEHPVGAFEVSSTRRTGMNAHLGTQSEKIVCINC